MDAFGTSRQESKVDTLMTIEDTLNFLDHRKKIIALTILACFLAGVLYCVFATRRYQATALIEVEQPADSFGTNGLVQGKGATAPQSPNPLEETVTLTTKVEELQSDNLILQVIDQLHLENSADLKSSFDPIGWVVNIFSPPSRKDAPGTSFLDSPARREKALLKFNRHLKVEIVPGTRLVSVKYASKDPELAAQVVNALANDLADYGYKIKSATTKQLSAWLADQLTAVRQNAETLQTQEAKLRRNSESYSIGTAPGGGPNIYNPVVDQLQQATAALNQTEANRILRSAVEQIVETRDPQLLSGLAGSGLVGPGNPQSVNSLDLINLLETQIAQQQATVSHDEVVLGDSFPKLVQEKAQLGALQSALRAEITRLGNRAKNDAIIARTQEEHTRTEHDQLLRRANASNDRYMRYQIVQQEAQDARQLYTDLNQRLREVGVVIGLQSADTTLFAPGLAPYKPHYPRKALVLIGAIMAGTFLGVMLGLGLDVFDDRISSLRQLKSGPNLPLLGTLPVYKLLQTEDGPAVPFESSPRRKSPRQTAVTLLGPSSPYAQAMRSLRASLILANPGRVPQVVLVTSTTRREGKSVTARNLAATFARAGQKVLLVANDSRWEDPGKLTEIEYPEGVPLGTLTSDKTVPAGNLSEFSVITAVHNSTRLEQSPDTEATKTHVDGWRKIYDVIILDGLPLFPMSDSVLLADQADSIILVARYNATHASCLRRACLILPPHLRERTAIVLNAVPSKGTLHKEYYGRSKMGCSAFDVQEGATGYV
jgi:succinoglycan biosynthesis transport protein ExoP